MRKGCVFAVVLLVIVLTAGGYIGYTMLVKNFAVPEELARYGEYESMMKLIRSTAPPPSDSAHLTPERVELFIGALDPLNAGWHELRDALDSLGGENHDHEALDIWKGPAMFREIFRLPLLTRRAMVDYLNSHNLSMAEYIWLKERTVAASGLTYKDFAGAFRDSLNRSLPMQDSLFLGGNEGATEFFGRVEELRRSNVIDSADIALVAPYRDAILSRGTGVLLSMEQESESLEVKLE